MKRLLSPCSTYRLRSYPAREQIRPITHPTGRKAPQRGFLSKWDLKGYPLFSSAHPLAGPGKMVCGVWGFILHYRPLCRARTETDQRPRQINMGDVPGTKVWVGNLGSTCEERDLRDEFSKFGELNKVRFICLFGVCQATNLSWRGFNSQHRSWAALVFAGSSNFSFSLPLHS